jgi:hypothetical protein
MTQVVVREPCLEVAVQRTPSEALLVFKRRYFLSHMRRKLIINHIDHNSDLIPLKMH